MKTEIRQKFIVANWKMHTTSFEAQQLSKSIVEGIAAPDHVTVVLCPPFPYLPIVGDMLRGSRVEPDHVARSRLQICHRGTQ